VIKTEDAVKNHKWIADIHSTVANDLCQKYNTELGGLIIDNTAANMAAMKLLQKQYPKACFVGCAHALDLFFKVLLQCNRILSLA
jgi:hypothetical protein